MIKKIIGLTVATIVILCVAIPIIDDVTKDNEKVMNVVVIAGQSNGVYMLADVPLVNEKLPQPNATCWYYGNGYIHKMNNNGQWTIGSVDPAIAYEIANYTNRDVLVINTNIGGKSIDYFTPGNAGSDWIDEVVTTALSAIHGYDKINKIGWVWIQGESDKDTAINDYIDDFRLIDAHFSSMGFNNCWISETRATDGGNATLAQQQIVSEFNNVFWGSRASANFNQENGTIYTDNLHYTQLGRLIIGEDIGLSILSKLPPTIETLPIRSLISVIPVIMIVSLAVMAAAMIFRSKQ